MKFEARAAENSDPGQACVEPRFQVRRPVRPTLPAPDMLGYLEAILRVYNLRGRRDSKYKAPIEILIDALGIEEFAAQGEIESPEAAALIVDTEGEDAEESLALLVDYVERWFRHGVPRAARLATPL